MDEVTRDINIELDCSDDDELNQNEIANFFPNSEHVLEECVSNSDYILHLCGSKETWPNICCSLTDHTAKVYNFHNTKLENTATLKGHTDLIVDCKFSNQNSNIIYTGSSNGNIKVWDIRTPKNEVNNFLDTTQNSGIKKVFNCFDVSPNEKLLAAGTDAVDDAYILFWDIRNVKLLGAYWESHTDDVTQVKFQKEDSNKLISGSTDGLINIYDLSEVSEDDALIDTLNTGSSIEQLHFFNNKSKERISCITHTNDIQLWNVEDAEPYKHFKRTDICKAIKRKSEDYTYVAKTHSTKNSLLILAGSNSYDGKCLRAVEYSNNNLTPVVNFYENKQRVRGSYYNENTNMLVTGGEGGLLNIWKVKYSK